METNRPKQVIRRNPFEVLTPENMRAEDVHNLFVEAYTDFSKIKDSGHMMISGPRGCGKSMIFRYLLPDCQSIAKNIPVADLDFWAFLVSIKNTSPNFTELKRLENHANHILNEHILTLFVAVKVFDFLSQRMNLVETAELSTKIQQYYKKAFCKQIAILGGEVSEQLDKERTVSTIFSKICDTLEKHYNYAIQYVKKIAFTSKDFPPFEQFLCSYNDFLFPLLRELGSIFSSSKPGEEKIIYLLIDDADYLNEAQTIVLNSWISTRTQGNVCIKVSTQMQYKTFATMSGLPIQTPHDYQTVNMADLYTTKQDRYLPKIKQIVEKRLHITSINVTPEEFFPQDEKQEKAIKEIENEIRQGETKGYRPSDDSYRYARPDYMKRLVATPEKGKGSSKSANTYSYAGFEQLVNISSGVIRYFLDTAAKMYDKQISESQNQQSAITCIEPRIQNEVIRKEADILIDSLYDSVIKENTDIKGGDIKQQVEKLYNLIRAIGGTFRNKLLSNESERRVFSFAITGIIDQEVQEVIDLGVRHGFFHQSYIGNKDGTGRTKLFVLTRRLAPHFNLDPTSFAGYQWLKIDPIKEALTNPDKILRQINKKNSDSVWNDPDSPRLPLED